MLNDIESSSKMSEAWQKLKDFKENKLPEIKKCFETINEQDPEQYFKTELEKGTYQLSFSNEKEENKQYIALIPKNMNTPDSTTTDKMLEDNFIFKITLNYDKEVHDEKGNSKYGTVEKIELKEDGSSESYSLENILEILHSPRCLERHNIPCHVYSTTILENYDYFSKQINGENIDFIFPIISDEEEKIVSIQHIIDNLLNKNHQTIFIPFMTDGHMILVRLDNDSGKKYIGFMDSSGYFARNITSNGELSNDYTKKNLRNFFEIGKEKHYSIYVINPKESRPQIDLTPMAYNVEKKYYMDAFLTGTCSYHARGVSNKIIKLLSNEDTKTELIKYDHNDMTQFYLETLYKESIYYTKEVLEKYLIPIYNNTKKQLEQISDTLDMLDNYNQEHINNIFSNTYKLYIGKNELDQDFKENDDLVKVTGIFIEKTNKGILIINPPKFQECDEEKFTKTIIIGGQYIHGKSTQIMYSILLGDGEVKDSDISLSKILYSYIIDSSILNSTIKDSAIENSDIASSIINHSFLSGIETHGDLTIQNSTILNNSEKSCYILGDNSVNLSNINLNINNDIEDNIIITTSDFLEKLKNPENSKQYMEYFNILTKNNIDINKLNTYNVDNNGIIILSKNKNLDLEINKDDNTIILNCNKHKNSLSILSTDVKYTPKASDFNAQQNEEEPKRGCSSCTIM